MSDDNDRNPTNFDPAGVHDWAMEPAETNAVDFYEWEAEMFIYLDEQEGMGEG